VIQANLGVKHKTLFQKSKMGRGAVQEVELLPNKCMCKHNCTYMHGCTETYTHSKTGTHISVGTHTCTHTHT
jgi:hypothetical protein